jgi:hypothetical protein
MENKAVKNYATASAQGLVVGTYTFERLLTDLRNALISGDVEPKQIEGIINAAKKVICKITKKEEERYA